MSRLAEAVLGVDVGGSKMALAPIDRTGRFMGQVVSTATQTRDTAAFLAGLEASIADALTALDDIRIDAIGLACAGTVDGERGVVATSPNLPLREMALAEHIERVFDVPVVLENDVNAAVWAECSCGAAVGYDHVVMVALGTGIGGGLVLDGRLYRGAGGGAAELGHTIVCRDGELCPCGARGCWEMYASGKALARFAHAYAGSEIDDPDGGLRTLDDRGALDGRAVTNMALREHPGAVKAVAELAVWLGTGLVGLVNAFNPEVVVVGGGVAALGDRIIEPAQRFMRAVAMPPNRDQVIVVLGALGNHAGVVGAALLAWNHLAASQA